MEEMMENNMEVLISTDDLIALNEGIMHAEIFGSAKVQIDTADARALMDMARRSDLAAPSAQPRDRCGNCGAFGQKCYGNTPDGPDCDDWIGETDGRACCYACYCAAPSGPAEVEGLVAALIKADRGHDPGTLFTEAATALAEMLDAETRACADELPNCAACGGGASILPRLDQRKEGGA